MHVNKHPRTYIHARMSAHIHAHTHTHTRTRTRTRIQAHSIFLERDRYRNRDRERKIQQAREKDRGVGHIKYRDSIHVNPERSFGGTNGEPPSEASPLRKGVPGSSPGKFQKHTLQMVQSTLFLSYISEYY